MADIISLLEKYGIREEVERYLLQKGPNMGFVTERGKPDIDQTLCDVIGVYTRSNPNDPSEIHIQIKRSRGNVEYVREELHIPTFIGDTLVIEKRVNYRKTRINPPSDYRPGW